MRRCEVRGCEGAGAKVRGAGVQGLNDAETDASASRHVAGARHFQELVCWQLSRELKLALYDLAERPEVKRDFSFCNRLRDAAASAPRKHRRRTWPSIACRLCASSGRRARVVSGMPEPPAGCGRSRLPVAQGFRQPACASRPRVWRRGGTAAISQEEVNEKKVRRCDSAKCRCDSAIGAEGSGAVAHGA